MIQRPGIRTITLRLMNTNNNIKANKDIYPKNDIISVANSGPSSVIADHLGLLVGQSRCRFLKMTEHS